MASSVAAGATARLGALLERRKDEVIVQDDQHYTRVTIRLNGRGIAVRDRVPGYEIGTKLQFRVRAGQLLLSKIDARNDAFGIVPNECDGAIITGNFWTFDVDESALLAQYFDYFTKTRLFVDFCIRASEGTTNRRYLQEPIFLDQHIPLPPLAEQRRIVARIEVLAARIEQARGLRREAMAEALALKRSALDQQFARLEATIEAVRLDAIARCRLGKMLSQQAKTGTSPALYLRNANVQWDRLDLSQVYEMDFSAEEREVFQLRRGDILVCEGGDIGKAAIWNDEMPGCCYQKALHRVRVNQEAILPRFILYHIFWHAQQGHFEDVKTQTTIAHLTGVKLNASNTHVPSKDEQRRIVDHLDDVSARLSALQKMHQDTAAELEALLPSVLDRAFRGEL